MKYSSKDFIKTGPEILSSIPENLVHKNVEKSGNEATFSNERGHGVAVVDLPTVSLSMTIGSLRAGQTTRKHRHNYETVLFILEGEGYSEVEDRKIPWKKGDAVYIPVWSWHRHQCEDSTNAKYLACENTPLLQNLGGIAIREEKEEDGLSFENEASP